VLTGLSAFLLLSAYFTDLITRVSKVQTVCILDRQKAIGLKPVISSYSLPSAPIEINVAQPAPANAMHTHTSITRD